MRPLRVSLFACLNLILAACAMGDSQSGRLDSGPVWDLSTTSAEARHEFEQGLAVLDLGNLPNNRSAPTAASEHFKRAITADPDFALAYFFAGYAAPSPDEGRANILRAKELAAGVTHVERLLIESGVLMLEEDVEGAIRAARELTQMDSLNARSWLALAELAHMVREDELRAAALKAVDVAPGFARPHLVLANSYVLAAPRDPVSAEKHARRAVELRPSEAAYDLLGDAQRAQGRFDDAVVSYTRAMELATSPESRGQGQQQRAHAHMFAGRYAEARADYSAVGSAIMGDMHANVGFYSSLVHVYEGRPLDAIAALEDGYARLDRIGLPDPAGWMTTYLDAVYMIALHHGEVATAAGALERMRAIAAAQATQTGSEAVGRAREAGLLGLEAMLSARRGDFAAARAAAARQEALVDASRDPRGVMNSNGVRGMIAFLEGRFADAAAHFERADRSSAYDLYHHGLALEALGRSDEARALFQQVAGIYFANIRLVVVHQEAKARAGT
jgi:tetratricopeptide (TPR) repeat protein